jgi:hypothetical protein
VKRYLESALIVMTCFMVFGCSNNYYNIPRESFEQKIKILGVAPIFVDAESDIRHPEKDALITIIKDENRKNEKELATLLSDTGTFFSVRRLDGDADGLFVNLLFRRERRDDASVAYNKYFYKLPELKEIITKNGLDALMLTVVSGLTREDTVRSGNLISYLKSDYNSLVMSSQIFDADGNVLWEFPNFRTRSTSFPALVELQYPDFDEAKANATDFVDVKFRSIKGITRILDKREDSSTPGGGKVSEPYVSVFKEMTDLLKPEGNLLPWSKHEEKAVPGSQQVPPTSENLSQPPVRQKVETPEAPAANPVKEEAASQPVKEEPVKEEPIKEESVK